MTKIQIVEVYGIKVIPQKGSTSPAEDLLNQVRRISRIMDRKS